MMTDDESDNSVDTEPSLNNVPVIQYEDLAEAIDRANEQTDVRELRSIIATCEERLATADETWRVELLYYVANAYSGISSAKRVDVGYDWSWEQSETISEVLTLRRVMIEPGFVHVDRVRRSQVTTNLANKLSGLGRSTEAIELWDDALCKTPRFAMAHGNRGSGLIRLAQSLYDNGHSVLLGEAAEQSLHRALHQDAFWDTGDDPAAKEFFEEQLNYVARHLGPSRGDLCLDREGYSLGADDAEITYRQWCLKERLFLNPLNDIMTVPLAANDVLHLPSHQYSIDEARRFPRYFNHLKQDYVSARYRMYSASVLDQRHPADENVLLLDGNDAAMLGHRCDQLKTAFRAAYSLFDKIAIFLNDYFKVGLDVRNTYFRRIFTTQVKGGTTVRRPVFEGSRNLPLRGLYYLSKDLFDPEFNEVAAPEAKELAALRHQLEHRFLTIQHYDYGGERADEHKYISFDEFFAKTLRLLKLSRAALTYLSLAMHAEEERRELDAVDDGIVVQIPSQPIS